MLGPHVLIPLDVCIEERSLLGPSSRLSLSLRIFVKPGSMYFQDHADCSSPLLCAEIILETTEAPWTVSWLMPWLLILLCVD